MKQPASQDDKVFPATGFGRFLVDKLQEAVAQDFLGFSVMYQPIVHAADGSLAGSEALLRWAHPGFPGISPQEFVPCLEDSGLIDEVGEWILREALRQCAQWQKYLPNFCMNINVASQQFRHPAFRFLVIDALNECGVTPGNVVLELTESSKAEDVSDAFDFLRSQGVHIAFDDFGTGYASLDIFRRLSADELKIDRSFLERLSYNVTDQALINMLINLCHSMNMSVCIEGIETDAMEALVRQMSPDFLQGYFYGRPMTAEKFEQTYFSNLEHPWAQPWKSGPEQQETMVYAPFRPEQPMRMEDMVDYAYAGLFQVGMDKEFTFLTCNEGYRRMLGYTMLEIEKKFKNRALGFVHPDDVQYVNDEIRRQLGEGDTVTIEFRVVRKDGTPIWILGTGNVYHSREGGSSLVVVIINNDQNKRKQLQMQDRYRLYQKLVENLPSGIKMVRYDPDFTIEYISAGFLKLMGYTQEDIKTKFQGKYINLIHPDDRASVISSIMEQLKKGDVVTMRYRTPCKSGKLIWVETISKLCPPDEDGIQRACSSLVDISEIMNQQEEERSHALNIAYRYETAASEWGEFLFEYNLMTDVLTSSENFNRIFHRDAKRRFPYKLELIHEDDRPAIMAAVEQCKRGERPQSLETRLLMPDGTAHWFSVAFGVPEKIGDTPVSVLGRFTDIDKEKRALKGLIEETQRDSMTGLLNKSTTETRIRVKLAEMGPEDHCAIFMIDFDYFKQINDTFGHFAGDETLRQAAKILKSLTRADDIVGRVGGDEFMIFLPYDGSPQTLMDKARQILDALRSQMIEKEVGSRSLSASIGIASFPEDGRNFYDLYRRADSALYRAKGLGRNCCCLASQTVEQRLKSI